MKRFLHLALLVCLCVAGAYVSGLLLAEHLDRDAGPTWFDDACGETEDEDLTNCDEVMESKWGTMLGMPSAYWGMTYFAGMGLWFLFIGQPSFEKRHWHLLPILANMAGAAGAVFFIVIMYTKLDERCFWCMVSHVINFAMLVLTLLLWPRRSGAVATTVPVVSADGVDGGEPDIAVSVSPLPPSARQSGSHPGTRLVFAVFMMAVVTGAYLWQGTAAESWRVENENRQKVLAKCEGRLGEFLANVSMLVQMYEKEPKRTIELRPDDPQKTVGDGKRHAQLVVFGDFECYYCRQFAIQLEKQINPVFDGHLRIVFKHYPISPHCNLHVKKNLHPHSCKTAQAAEAARMQGGNDAFWKAHDILFEGGKRKMLGKLNYRKLAEQLGIDPDRFIADMDSEEVAQRIKEDIDLAKSLGVTSTPAVFLSGRRVPSSIRGQTEFWKEMARRFKILTKRLEKKRSQSTGKKPTTRPAVTQGSRGRPGAR